MRLTELNWECLLHLFSFLDKNSRKSLAQTCRRLLRVFQDASLWPLLHFHSLAELTKDNFVLGPALRHLSICWHSSQVKVCNVEDWMKNQLQRNICSLHKHLVNEFLLQVSNGCPSLRSLKLSGCGHVTDDSIVLLLKSCPGLRSLQLENCVLITDQTLEAVALHADSLQTLHVDFCRNITAAGVAASPEDPPVPDAQRRKKRKHDTGQKAGRLGLGKRLQENAVALAKLESALSVCRLRFSARCKRDVKTCVLEVTDSNLPWKWQSGYLLTEI